MTNKIEQAHELFRKGEVDEAIALYREILAADSQNADLWHVLAIMQAQSGKTKDAQQSVQQAIKLNQQEPTFYNSAGNILLRQGKYEDAVLAFKKAIKLNPKYAIAYNNLANSYYRSQKFDQAKAAYKKAITLKKNYTDAYYNIGILQTALGEMDAATENLKKALALSPKYAAALRQLGAIHLDQEKFTDAIGYFEQCIELVPDHEQTQFDLGIALLQNNQIDDAIARFENTLMLNPKHPECNHYLANAHLQAGDTSKAINYYFHQLEIQPMVESYYNIGVLFMHQNRHKEAIQYLTHAAELDPGYLPTHLNLGALYLKLNRLDMAKKHYQEALRIKPGDAEIQHIIDAVSEGKTPDQAPSEYLQHLFDQYATYYDKHLTEHLQYRVPELIHQAIFDETGAERAEWTILDLGCGTGLVGQLLKPLAKKLIGIDISEKMVDIARSKDIYDELQVADVQVALEQHHNSNLIIAADVFTYIGKLDEVFLKAKSALSNDGMFIFSVEKTAAEPYILQKTIRYAHSKKYLDQLIQNNGFKILRFDNIVLRKQRNKPVEGYLVILQLA